MIPFADLKRQYINLKSEIDACIHESLENTAFIGGNGILEFERSFSGIHWCSALYCLWQWTDSIEILLKALGVREGDEVLVPIILDINLEAVSSQGNSCFC